MTVVSAADTVVPLMVGLATVAVSARVASIAVTRVAATQALNQSDCSAVAANRTPWIDTRVEQMADTWKRI